MYLFSYICKVTSTTSLQDRGTPTIQHAGSIVSLESLTSEKHVREMYTPLNPTFI